MKYIYTIIIDLGGTLSKPITSDDPWYGIFFPYDLRSTPIPTGRVL